MKRCLLALVCLAAVLLPGAESLADHRPGLLRGRFDGHRLQRVREGLGNGGRAIFGGLGAAARRGAGC